MKPLAAAEKGFQIWRNTSAYDRARFLRRAADLVWQCADAIAEIMTLEQGKSLMQSRLETLCGADSIDWFIGEAQRT